MYLLDTNIIIYSIQKRYSYLDTILSNRPLSSVSLATKIEVLGFVGLTQNDKRRFEGIFSILSIIPITDIIADNAIRLKQSKKMSLGDSIIAATALEHNLTLVTNNISDFKHIKELKLLNPIK